MNKHGWWLMAAGAAVLGIASAVVFEMNSYVDATGRLHEPFYLVPLTMLLLVVTVVFGAVALVQTLRPRLKH